MREHLHNKHKKKESTQKVLGKRSHYQYALYVRDNRPEAIAHLELQAKTNANFNQETIQRKTSRSSGVAVLQLQDSPGLKTAKREALGRDSENKKIELDEERREAEALALQQKGINRMKDLDESAAVYDGFDRTETSIFTFI